MFKTLGELWSTLTATERRYLRAGFFMILIMGGIAIFILPLIFSLPGLSWMSFKNTGAIGDTINGIAGPFIALIGATLTFLAFYIQYKANVQQRRQFISELKRQNQVSKDQEKVWKIERFENRFFELIKLHKANVNEMNIGDRVRGSKCFVPMFYELRYCYTVVEDFIKSTHNDVRNEYGYDLIDQMDMAYKVFFYGIGASSEKQYVYKLSNGEFHLFKQIKDFFEVLQGLYLRDSQTAPDKKVHPIGLRNPYFNRVDTTEFSYYPYDGHVNRLGHYYRHLFQSVNYVIAQEFLDDDQKYSYIKTLRAQLSNFEQLLLYYNALAWFDEQWHEAFTDFRFIKNLPLPLADFGTPPEIHFDADIKRLAEKDIMMFELHE
jgi:hypothetical protein